MDLRDLPGTRTLARQPLAMSGRASALATILRCTQSSTNCNSIHGVSMRATPDRWAWARSQTSSECTSVPVSSPLSEMAGESGFAPTEVAWGWTAPSLPAQATSANTRPLSPRSTSRSLLAPTTFLLFMHHVPYTYRLHSHETVIQHIDNSHYWGAKDAAAQVPVWESIRGIVSDATYAEVLKRLQFQAGHAIVWRDAITE